MAILARPDDNGAKAMVPMMTPQFEIALACGAVGALLMVLSNLMKRMVALRLFATGANAFFVIQFVLEHNWILIGLQATLFAINVWRLWSLRQTLRSLEAVNAHAAIKDGLLPQMKKKRFKPGAVLFQQGEPANKLFYIRSGTVRSPEINQVFGPGNLIGEIGMFSEDRLFAATVICQTDVVAHTMTDEAAYVLFVSNPQIGLYLVRLIIQQLRRQIALRPAP